MSKKIDNDFEHPPYEKISSMEEVDMYIVRHKDRLVGKDLTESQMKGDKKEYVASLNEQLKELAEERNHEMDVIIALLDRRKQISTKGVPLPTSPVGN